MTRQAFAFIVFSLFLIFGIKILSSNSFKVSKVSILPIKQLFLGGKMFSVELATTDVSKERGLSGHNPLLSNQGMLFVFDTPDKYRFWMKDMVFPIDIIWLDKDFRIVYIQKSVSPETYPKIFYPDTLAEYVLEIASGQSDELKLKIGDTATFSK